MRRDFKKKKFLTDTEKTAVLEVAHDVIERLNNKRLTRIHFDYLNEVPFVSGVYLAATEDDQILYIGKADLLSRRCKIPPHEKLPLAIEQGAVYLYVASVPFHQAWYVEQYLISKFSPPLNIKKSEWWARSSVAQTLDGDLEAVTDRLCNFLASGEKFYRDSPEIQEFFTFVKEHSDDYYEFYGLKSTGTSAPVELISTFCRTQFGVKFQTKKIGKKREQVNYYWVDADDIPKLVQRYSEKLGLNV